MESSEAMMIRNTLSFQRFPAFAIFLTMSHLWACTEGVAQMDERSVADALQPPDTRRGASPLEPPRQGDPDADALNSTQDITGDAKGDTSEPAWPPLLDGEGGQTHDTDGPQEDVAATEELEVQASDATEPASEIDTLPAPPPDYDCGDAELYLKAPLGQWRVCHSFDLSNNEPLLSDQTLALLQSNLTHIEGLLAPSILLKLQEVRIWVERDIPAFPGAVYHPSAGWLTNEGYPSYWAKGIQIGNAANYLDWTSLQPAMVLHELSHAWHHQVLGYEHEEIKAAFEAAMASGIYQDVAYAGGGTLEAYATSNVQEYFAELSEAYFWTNDFYPFNASELSAFDPQGFAAIDNAWQPLE
mgnify:CR=1 FL=1